MIATPDLIDSLAGNLRPVRRLRPPLVRAACWLLLAAAIVALVAVSRGVRPDLAERLQHPDFVVRVAGALLTGVLAAAAAFLSSLPDRSRLWALLPAPAAGVWVSTIGYQCLTNWVSIGPDGISLGETARCFATLVLTSVPLSIAMLGMLRYAALLRPISVCLTGALAVAAITATALALLHPIDATALILMWNLGMAVLFVTLAGAFGRRILSWVAPRPVLFGE